MIRAIIQATVAGSQVVGRAFISAVRKEYNGNISKIIRTTLCTR